MLSLGFRAIVHTTTFGGLEGGEVKMSVVVDIILKCQQLKFYLVVTGEKMSCSQKKKISC